MRKNFYKFSILFVAVFGFTSLRSQMNLTWEEIGPNNLGTHVRAIAVSGNNVWAGSIGGGFWRSTNLGATWSMVAGVDHNLAVSSVATEGNNIYVGTGETYFYKPLSTLATNWTYDMTTSLQAGFHGYSGMPGEGVFVSNDGGATWSHSNGTWNGSSTPYEDDFMSIQKIVVKGGRVFIATLAGLYYSDNADLSTVTKCNGTTNFTTSPVTDVEFGSGSIIWAATGDSLYKSTDGGITFGAAINSLIPTTAPSPYNRLGGDRIDIAVAPSSPNVVYVTGAIESITNGQCTGVFKSSDDGGSWSRVAPYESGTFIPFGGKGYYNLVLAVKTDDPNSYYIGGKNLYVYSDADGLVEAAEHTYLPGFIDNYVPTPQLTIAMDASNPDVMFIGTDHEIVKTTDGGLTYHFATKGFNNGHINSVTANSIWEVAATENFRGIIHKFNSNPDPAYHEFEVLNDDAAGWLRYATTNNKFIVASGSDNGVFRSLSGGETWETFYGYPIDSCGHANLGTDSLIVDRPTTADAGGNIYDGGVPSRNPWVLDEVLDPSDLANDTTIMNVPVYLYMATRHFVWVCTNPFGTLDSLPSWNRISNNLVSSGTNPREFITALAVSGDDNHCLFVGTNLGKIFRIMNANDVCTLDPLTQVVRVDVNSVGMPARWITSFAFDPNNRNNVVVTYGSYENSATSYVYITNAALNASAALVTWRAIGDNLAEKTPVYTAAFHPEGGLLIGTEIGAYGTTSDWTVASPLTWNNESNGPGRVAIQDIYIRPYYKVDIDGNNWSYGADNTIFIATQGRGIFKSRTLVGTEPQVTLSDVKMNLYPNPMNNGSQVELSLKNPAEIQLAVFSLDGRKVADLGHGKYPAGTWNFDFNTSGLQAGMYIVNASFTGSGGTHTKSIKAIVIH
jgi:hypothetical protein